MAVFCVREFVREHRHDLVVVIVFYQIVIQGDRLLFRQARAESICTGRSSACVADDDLFYRDSVLAAQSEQIVLQVPLLQRIKLIEDPHQRNDNQGDQQRDQNECNADQHQARIPEPVVQEHDHDHQAIFQNDADQPGFDGVEEEGLPGRLIHPVRFLDHERVVIPERNGNDRFDRRDQENHEEILQIYLPAVEKMKKDGVQVQRQHQHACRKRDNAFRKAEPFAGFVVGHPSFIFRFVIDIPDILRDHRVHMPFLEVIQEPFKHMMKNERQNQYDFYGFSAHVSPPVPLMPAHLSVTANPDKSRGYHACASVRPAAPYDPRHSPETHSRRRAVYGPGPVLRPARRRDWLQKRC